MPQPIDMQTELARATITERIQDTMGRTSLAALQRAADEKDAARVAAQTQVDESNETDNRAIDGEDRRKNPFASRRRRREKSEGGQDEKNESAHQFYTAHDGATVVEDPDDHQIDISI